MGGRRERGRGEVVFFLGEVGRGCWGFELFSLFFCFFGGCGGCRLVQGLGFVTVGGHA